MIKADILQTLRKIFWQKQYKTLIDGVSQIGRVYLQKDDDCVFAASCVCVFIPQCRSYPDCSLGFWGARCVQVVDIGMKRGLCSFHWIPASPPSYHNQSSSGLNVQRGKQILYTGANTEHSYSLANPPYLCYEVHVVRLNLLIMFII